MTGAQSAVTDTIVSAFMIPFATCLIVTPIARRQMRSGRIAALNGGALSALMPSGILWRAILLGAACVAIVSPIVIGASAQVSAMGIALRHFLLFKLAFAPAEGAVITPLVAALAISRTDVTQRKKDRPSTAERLLNDAEAISIRRSIELRAAESRSLDGVSARARPRSRGLIGSDVKHPITGPLHLRGLA